MPLKARGRDHRFQPAFEIRTAGGVDVLLSRQGQRDHDNPSEEPELQQATHHSGEGFNKDTGDKTSPSPPKSDGRVEALDQQQPTHGR